MATRKSRTPARRVTQEAKRLQAIYTRSRAQFTAADLQRFTEVEQGVPFKTVLAKLEKLHGTGRKKRA